VLPRLDVVIMSTPQMDRALTEVSIARTLKGGVSLLSGMLLVHVLSAAVKRRQGARIEEILSVSVETLEPQLVGRVKALVSKSLPLARDGHMQMIEDATCLVFLGTELDHFAANGISGPKTDASIINILAKTWQKMSRVAHSFALGIPTFSPRMLGCLCQAIEQAEQPTAAMAAVPLPAGRVEGAGPAPAPVPVSKPVALN
jgi:hypothetical protein